MKNNKGVALVEFAIVLPLLIILLFGIIEFGFIIYDKAMITNASREGARLGIVFRAGADGPILPDDPFVQSDIEDRISNYLGNYLISLGSNTPIPTFANGGITTSLTPNSEGQFTPGGVFTVNITYPYSFVVISKLIGSGPTVNLSATTIMRLE